MNKSLNINSSALVLVDFITKIKKICQEDLKLYCHSYKEETYIENDNIIIESTCTGFKRSLVVKMKFVINDDGGYLEKVTCCKYCKNKDKNEELKIEHRFIECLVTGLDL